jgi:hypothetical protein
MLAPHAKVGPAGLCRNSDWVESSGAFSDFYEAQCATRVTSPLAQILKPRHAQEEVNKALVGITY